MSNLVRDFLLRILSGVYHPRSSLLPWQWHEEKNTQLEAKESQDYAGPYDSSLAPQNRFFMEFAAGRFSENIEFLEGFEDQVWRECVIMKSSQVGVTLSILLVIVWWIAEIRKNIIYAIDSLTEARRISEARLQPLIRGNTASAGRIQEGEDGLNILTLNLLGLIIYMLGGHSEGGFQNKSVTLGVIDEADYHPPPAAGQQDNVEELRSRTKAVSDAKIYVISKPKSELHVTYSNYKDGTRHKCFVPCPHPDCGKFQELVWEQVRYEHCKDEAGEYDLERVRLETYYECIHCQQKIEERHKREMMLRHRWRQTNPKPQPKRLSAHISDLYSQFSTATWGVLATEYIPALKSYAKMTTFRRDRLGKPARPIGTSVRKEDDILRLRCETPRYWRGTIPVKPVLTVICADVQGDVRKWVKGGFVLPNTLYVIDWGQTLAFEDLLDEYMEPVPVGRPFEWKKTTPWEGETVICEQGTIDEGYAATKVRRFCLNSEGLFVPTKGRADVQAKRTVVESDAECDGEPVIVYHFNEDAFKKELYVDSISGLDKIIAGKSEAMRIFMPWDLEMAFAEELCSEKLTTEIDRWGFSKEKFKKDPSIPNDWGDALKQMPMVWYWLGPRIVEESRIAALAARGVAAN